MESPTIAQKLQFYQSESHYKGDIFSRQFNHSAILAGTTAVLVSTFWTGFIAVVVSAVATGYLFLIHRQIRRVNEDRLAALSQVQEILGELDWPLAHGGYAGSRQDLDQIGVDGVPALMCRFTKTSYVICACGFVASFFAWVFAYGAA